MADRRAWSIQVSLLMLGGSSHYRAGLEVRNQALDAHRPKDGREVQTLWKVWEVMSGTLVKSL